MMSAFLFALFALMTAVAVLAVLWPLSRSRTLKGEWEADIAVYRDQLAEIDRDRESGLLPQEQAEAARTEVARRMLAADAARARETTAVGGTGRRRVAAVMALVLVPLIGAGIYLQLGAPEIPGAPLAARMAAPGGDIAILVRKVEEHLAENPDDGRGWEVLAPIYLRAGRPTEAARAWAQAIRTLGPSAPRYSMLGEALLMANNGIVGTDALAAFKNTLRLDSTEPRASFFLGLAAEQDGRPADALAIWSTMLARAPQDAPYLPMLRQALARIGGTASPAAAPVAAPAPPAEIATPATNASAAPGGDENAMIRGMVQRLENRLAGDPRDLDGWLRLVRAYVVMKEPDKARQALDSASAAFAGDAGALERIDAARTEMAGGG